MRRRTLYAILMLLLAVPALAQSRGHEPPAKSPAQSDRLTNVGNLHSDFDAMKTPLIIIDGARKVEIWSDGRVMTDGDIPAAARAFWDAVSKMVQQSRLHSERDDAIAALELALSHLKLSDASLGIGMLTGYIQPDTPIEALRRQANAMEKRDADIKSIAEALDRLKNRKEQ